MPFFLAGALPAAAEVCDKVNPEWSPEDGRTGQFGEAVIVLGTPVGLVVLATFVASLVLRGRWPNVLAIGMVGMFTVLLVAGRLLSGNIHQAAINEGCRAEPWLPGAILALMLLVGFGRLVRAGKPWRAAG